VPKKTEPPKEKRFLGLAALRRRYDCSHMRIERWLATDPTFPRPVKLGAGTMAHRAWDEDEIVKWERSRVVRSA
jgi:predicted DNA-binding transcriptional regulator AlpA